MGGDDKERERVWELEPDEMTKMYWESSWLVASLPVLTFKMFRN